MLHMCLQQIVRGGISFQFKKKFSIGNGSSNGRRKYGAARRNQNTGGNKTIKLTIKTLPSSLSSTTGGHSTHKQKKQYHQERETNQYKKSTKKKKENK